MARSILPKLGAGLAALQINPAHQPPESLAAWRDAMAWAPYLGPGQVRPPFPSCCDRTGYDQLVWCLLIEHGLCHDSECSACGAGGNLLS